MIILIGNLKGGVGKTTLSLALSSHLSQKEQKVTLLDMESSAPLYSLYKEEYSRANYLPYSVEHYLDPRKKWDYAQLLQKKTEPGYFIVDLPSFPKKEHQLLIQLSDLVVVPYEYSSLTLRSTLVFINYLKLLNNGSPIFFLRWNLNRSRVYKNQSAMDLSFLKEGEIIRYPVYNLSALSELSVKGLSSEQRAPVARAFDELYEYIQVIENE